MYFKQIASNKKAYHNYFIEDKLEAGISLLGGEVKSLRSGKISIKEAFILIRQGEMFLVNAHIPEYKYSTYDRHEPLRTRKLLLKRQEINKMRVKIEQQGYTIVPLKIYFKGNFVKVEIGLAKGKHNYDKRATLKNKEQNREVARAIKFQGND